MAKGEEKGEVKEPLLKKDQEDPEAQHDEHHDERPRHSRGSKKYNNVPHKKKGFFHRKENLEKSFEDYPDRFIISNEPDEELPDNSISTTKYNFVNFVPKNLFEQFSKLANLYFLVMGFLQMIPSISESEGKPYIYVPLTLVIIVSMIKDLFEDLSRRKDDHRENKGQTLRLEEDGFKQCNWEDLRVGDVVKVENGEFIPADLILLRGSDNNGTCYVETKNLDGETNLKPKNVEKELYDFYGDDEHEFWEKKVEVEYEHQNPNLYNFTGTMKLEGDKKIPLDNKNVLLRSCSLKSDYAIGIVAYSGHHTKIMLNSVSARPKSSKVERMMNTQIFIVFMVQIIWCILSAIYATLWYQYNKDSLSVFYPVDDSPQSPFEQVIYFAERFGAWLILFTNFVPISLIVTLEMVKFIQAHVVEHDSRMVDSVIESKPDVHTSSLMEELGQVQYIFADKTGTLTRNVMEFKQLSVYGKIYGDKGESEGKSPKKDSGKEKDKFTKDRESASKPRKESKDSKASDKKEEKTRKDDKKDKEMEKEKEKEKQEKKEKEEKEKQKKEEKEEKKKSDKGEKKGHNIELEKGSPKSDKKKESKDEKKEKEGKKDKSDKDVEEGEESGTDEVSNVDFDDEHFFEVLEGEGEERDQLHEMIFLLSVCHSANLDTRDDKKKYTASSPDDIALVNFAKMAGYEYIGSDENGDIKLKLKDDKEIKVKMLQQLEFSSDRKMMSAIIENEEGEIILYCKGADSAIQDIAAQSENDKLEEIKKSVDKFAEEGLRTLMCGKRKLEKSEYESWSKKYEEAQTSMEDREEKMNEVQKEIEKDLIIIGATGIEDKLQDEVDETIATLKQAGIKVWVLTGDKTETAINIGYSCKLLDDKQKIFKIDVTTKEELSKRIQEITREIKKKKLGGDKPYALVITGKSLAETIDPDTKGGSNVKLFNLLAKAEAVLGCRVSPKQKRDVVEVVKKGNRKLVTLAIGDGANDVNMINAAHVGVGIKGQEGYQAARASDFAIGEFKLLRRLLFYYGRESYRKNSYLVLYNFFKNIVLILPQFWYGFYNGMSGTIIYDPLIYQFFNVFFAAVPIIIFAVFDQELNSEFLEKNPEYYAPGLKDNYYNFKLFWYWFGSGTIQSIFIAGISFGSLSLVHTNGEGRIPGYWNAGMMALCGVVICVNLKILLFSNSINFIVVFFLLASFGMFIGTFKVLSIIKATDLYNQFSPVFGCWYFYAGIILIIVTTTLWDSAFTKYENEKGLISEPVNIKQAKKGMKKKHRGSGDTDRDSIEQDIVVHNHTL